MKYLIFIGFFFEALSMCIGQEYNEENIFNQLNHTTVQIFADKYIGDTKEGKPRYKRGRGTGFFLNLDILKERQLTYLVTNRHVIQEADRIVLVFTEKKDGKPVFGSKIELDLGEFSNIWIPNNDRNVDLAAMPMTFLLQKAKDLGKDNIYYRTIPASLMADSIDWIKLTPMSQVVMIGYPMGLSDEVNNTPLFRSGVISSSPHLDFNGKKDFVIDIASFNGSSGSPVFMYEEEIKNIEKGLTVVKNIKLIGVLYQGVFRNNLTSEIFYESNIWKDDLKPSTPLNLGIAVKVSALSNWRY